MPAGLSEGGGRAAGAVETAQQTGEALPRTDPAGPALSWERLAETVRLEATRDGVQASLVLEDEALGQLELTVRLQRGMLEVGIRAAAEQAAQLEGGLDELRQALVRKGFAEPLLRLESAPTAQQQPGGQEGRRQPAPGGGENFAQPGGNPGRPAAELASPRQPGRAWRGRLAPGRLDLEV